MEQFAETNALPAQGEGVSTSGPDLTGRVVGDFRVVRRLGQGGMGQVYLAEQISLKRNVALKVLRPELARNAQSLARFKKEAEAVAKATHANIVQVYSISDVDAMPYMALEYVEGRNLREYLAKKGPPELILALSIMRQVASALTRAGDLGIVHRDIKPDNILLTRKGEVKVADFGLSRIENDPGLHLTQSGVTMGTPLYMSPEQAEGKAVDCRSDIYSFGVTCYHMLAGEPPFRGATAVEVALQHLCNEPPPLSGFRPDLPPALCAMVHRMMAKQPEKRYQTARDLLRELIRLREGMSNVAATTGSLSVELVPIDTVTEVNPIDVEPVGTAGSRNFVATSYLENSAEPAQRPRWQIATLVALSLVVCLAAGFGLSRIRSHSPTPSSGTPVDIAGLEGSIAPPNDEAALRRTADMILNTPGKTSPRA